MMSKIKNKKNFQLLNIISTLIEATEHLSELIKRKEMNQSVSMLNSILEGVGAVANVINQSQSIDKTTYKEKVEQSLLLIAQEMEKERLIKVSEIIQFSLLPELRKWKQNYEEHKLDTENKSLTVGIYLGHTNPRDIMPEARVNALVEEGKKQNAKLVFFCSDDITFENKTINGEVFKDDLWQQASVPFPEVIYNLSVGSRIKQSQVERKLRRELPFTNFGLGNKYHLPEALIKNRIYADLLVPFKIIKNESTVYNFFDKKKKAVIKPILGRQGSSVFLVEKKGGHYSIWEGKKERVVGQKKFNDWIQAIIAVKNNDYMIQNYVEARTKNGEPFDVRAHMQKNSEGKWQITKIYPRIGHKKSILSNISQGGRTEEFEAFMNNEFDSKGNLYSSELRKLAMDLTIHVDKLMDYSLNDLGIDLTIDKSGKFWMHEINNGPESKYHEQEWAANTIGYASYIAKNGIYKMNEFQKRKKLKGAFNARTMKLPAADLDQAETAVGMLVSENDDDKLAIACAYVAKYEDKHFYYFTPKDIDYEMMLIRGYFYENKEWIAKVVRYPDVIYDRLRLKGIGNYKFIYEELDGIPITNEFFGNSISKLEVYDKLKETGELDKVIIPYQKVNRTKEIMEYIQRFKSVIVKPEVGSFAQGVYLVSKLDSGEYLVAGIEEEKYYNELSLTALLKKWIDRSSLLVQRYIKTRTKENKAFDIRVHLMKDGNNEWSIIESYPRIGVKSAILLVLRSGGYIGKLIPFIERNFGKRNSEKIISNIKELSYKTANVFDGLYMNRVSEIALDWALDKEGNLYLIELNVNKPGIASYEFEVAQHAIPYAIYLAELDKK